MSPTSTSVGLLWAGGSAVVARLSALIAQIVLGWALAKDDFAVYAIAISTASIVSSFRNGGLFRCFVRNYPDLRGRYPAVLLWGLIVDTVLAIALVSAAPLVTRMYASSAILPLLAIIAVSLPLGTFGAAYRAKLTADSRFAHVARIDAGSALVRNASMILLAILGFGPYSFVVPLIFAAIYEGVAGARYAGSMRPGSKGVLVTVRATWRESGWIVIGAVVVSLALQGEYLVIGWFESKDTLGVYFFSLQLVIALTVLVTSSIDTVLFPALSRLQSVQSELHFTFLKYLERITLVTSALLGAMAVGGQWIVHAIWGSKWEDAGLIIGLMCLGFVVRMPLSVGLALLEAVGKWKQKAALIACDAVTLCVVVGIAASYGGLLGIVVATTLYRCVGGLVVLTAVGGMADCVSVRGSVSVTLRALLPLVLAATVGFLGKHGFSHVSLFWSTLLGLTAYLFVYICASRVLFPEVARRVGTDLFDALTNATRRAGR